MKIVTQLAFPLIMGLCTVIMAAMPTTRAVAAENSIAQFFSATEGSWSGTGTTKKSIGQGGTYKIGAQQKTKSDGATEWSVTTSFTGSPGTPDPTTTIYRLTAKGMDVVSTQYSVAAIIIKSTPTALAFRTVHSDPVTGSTVELARSLKLTSPSQLQVTAVISQNGRVVQVYNYELHK